jgi:DNA-binding transcriptional regulator YiaG
MKKKYETFVYKGFGFPVELINCPLKEIQGEWVLDINLIALQKLIFKMLIHKKSPLTNKELKFMRKFLRLTTSQVGEKLGISHATVVKWESGQSKISLSQQIYIRLIFCEIYKDEELIQIFKEIRPENLAKPSNKQETSIQIDLKDIQVANF